MSVLQTALLPIGQSVAKAARYQITADNYAPAPSSTINISAQLLTADGVPDPTAGRTVTWSYVGPAGATFGSPTSITDGSGIATVTMTVGGAGSSYVTKGIDNLGIHGSTALIAVTLIPAKYLVTSSNYSPNPGTIIIISAQVVDASNTPIAIPGYIVTWSKTGAGGSFSSPTSVTNSSGIATVSFTVGAAGVVYAITALDGASLTGTSSDITVNTVAVAYSVTSSNYSPAFLTNVTISAQLIDSFNNPVATAGLLVTWSKTGVPGGTFSSPSTPTNGLGIATVTFTVGAAGVVHTVTGTDTNGLTGTSPDITVTSDARVHFPAAHFSPAHFQTVHFP